jgi:hypothetical protein
MMNLRHKDGVDERLRFQRVFVCRVVTSTYIFRQMGIYLR